MSNVHVQSSFINCPCLLLQVGLLHCYSVQAFLVDCVTFPMSSKLSLKLVFVVFVHQIKAFRSCHTNKYNEMIMRQNSACTITSYPLIPSIFHALETSIFTNSAGVHVLLLPYKNKSPVWVKAYTTAGWRKRKWAMSEYKHGNVRLEWKSTVFSLFSPHKGRGGKTSASQKFTEHKNRLLLFPCCHNHFNNTGNIIYNEWDEEKQENEKNELNWTVLKAALQDCTTIFSPS